jgi:hypothetical protein
MKHTYALLSLSLLAIAFVGVGCNQSSTTKLDGGVAFEEATLTVSPTAYSFPDLTIGEASPAQKFQLTNLGFESTGPVSHVIEGSTEFVITGSTCGQPLPYQQSCEVSVVFRPIAPGVKMARLTVAANPGKMFMVLLNANARVPSSVRLAPTVYDFPMVAIPTPTGPQPMPPVGTFIVTNSGGDVVGPFSATVDGADATEFAISDNSCEGTLLQAAATCSISVRFKPTTSGPKTATLTVTGGNNLMLPPATLSGTGLEAAKLTLNPTSQSFGMVPLGMKSAFSFDVTNEGGSDAGKVAVSLEGMNFTEFSVATDASCDMPLQPGVSCGITITFSPTLAGPKTASLRVSSSPGGFDKAELSATAITSLGQISLSSPSPDPFGTVTVGESSTGFFVVENKGTAAAGKVMPSVSGSSSAEFVVMDNSCPDHLDPSQQCGVTVRFSPQFIGRRTGNLQVNALPGGFATLPIGGNAVANAQLRISPQSRNFSDRVIGSTSNIQTQSFIVTNIGAGTTGPLMVSIEAVDPNQAASFELFGINDCMNMPLLQNRTCRVDVRFLPKIRGFLSGNIVVQAQPGGTVRASMTGRGCQGTVTNANCQ